MTMSDPAGSVLQDSPMTARDELIIEVADSAAQRDAVYRFRYRIYCELLNRTQRYADHTAKTIQEPFDERGVIISASVNGVVIGTVRFNWANDPHAEEYIKYYRMDSIEGIELGRCTFTTKLMVDPSLRSVSLGIRLACAAFRLGTEYGGLADFIDCNPPKERYFQRLGYRTLDARFEHPEYGLVTPMVLINNDINHLICAQSPFARMVSLKALDPAWIRQLVPRLSVLEREPNKEN